MMWFLAGFVIGGIFGFFWPVYVLREVCIEFEDLRRELAELEWRELKLRQRITLDNRRSLQRTAHHNLEPSRN